MATPAIALGGPIDDWENPEQIGLWQDAAARFRRNPLAVAGLAMVLLLGLAALSAPLLVQLGIVQDPLRLDVSHELAPPSAGHLLGTDYLGRDMLSRLMFGAEISLMFGIGVQFLIVVIGGAIGLIAGYLGGAVDNLLMRFTDIMYAFPDLLWLLVVVSVFGKGLVVMFAAAGSIYWVGLARLVRGQVLSIREKEYVESARATGSSPSRIIVRHMIPNVMSPVTVSLTFGIPIAIFLEATLSFLGLGIPPPTPSWGVMVADGYQAIFADPLNALLPSIAIALTMLSFTFIGDGLRDALDPRMRR
jgi:oligopeptide transport system permease protein